MQKLYDTYRSQGFTMVAINTNPEQNADLPAWRDKGKYTFPILLSPDGDYAMNTYGVLGTPTNMILNADGKLVFRHLGFAEGNEKIMEAEIRELLGLDPFAGLKAPKTDANGMAISLGQALSLEPLALSHL